VADEFIADPTLIRSGGGATDSIGTALAAAAKAFEVATTFDPQDPPWGDDDAGRQFAAAYVEPHAQLRDAFTALATGVRQAGELAISSGVNFQKTQNEALGEIEGGRR